MNHSVSYSLDTIRHSTAHLLAQAVKQLFPTAQVTIGPVIEDGFYYDFAYERAFTLDDLVQIEARMHELAKKNMPITVKTYSRAEAIALFEALGEDYKVDIIQNIPPDETLTVYSQGDFQDLCRGPHVKNTEVLRVFKLMRVAGAYWRGDSNNPMLQRIYGTAWHTQEELNAYLTRLEEAEKRDHRKLGVQLDLFHLQEDAPGMVFWHPKGWAIYQTIKQYIRQELMKRGYQEIHTPQLLGRILWEKSGHWDKFFSDMFTTQSEEREFAVKPMNCPGHIQVFKSRLHSYRDLPLRFAEFGCCHRNEPSGSLHGLLRVRSFVQDDAHIFCTETQIQSEVSAFIDSLYAIYQAFGFENITLKLATRPEKRVGSDAIWDKAEEALIQALQSKQLNWIEAPGEGAFYGPKIEFSLQDCLNRVWQCGTIQVDFSMPERLGAFYVTEDNERQTPIMLHRAIIGSVERFIGILIEHYAGKLPFWLAPTQVIVMNITHEQVDYAKTIQAHLIALGFRAEADLRNEKIGFKIREQTLHKIPYQIIIGAKEKENQTISVRTREGQQWNQITLDEFQNRIKADEHHS
jgi:threonyl-tRNA synthetase